MLFLPDEIWITILYEWMDKTTTLCAFDMALCNQVLRERYLRWFQPASTVAQLSNIPFEIVQSKRNMSQNTLELLFTWCEKRRIYPKSLLLGLFSVKKQEKTRGRKRQNQQSQELLFDWNGKLGTLQHLETLKVFYCHNVMSSCNSMNFMNLLNLFPNLQKLLVMYAMYPKTFDCVNLHHSYYSLITLALYDVIFKSNKKEFERLVQVCPMLQEVNLANCYELYFHHIDYLITHAKHLTTVLYYPCRDNEHLTLIPIANGDIVSTSMRSLYFELMEEEENDPEEIIVCYENLCTILSKCPLVEKVHLYELCFYAEQFETSRLKQVISSSWQHLEALRLQNSTFPLEMLQHISSTCSNTLKRLYIQIPYEISLDEPVKTVITKSFPHLQILTIDFCDLDDFDCLMDSSFCNSLQALTLSPTTTAFQREDFLTAFPALLSLSLKLIDYTPLITPYTAMSRIHTLKLRSNNDYSPFHLVEAKDIGKINKKTINVDLPPIDHVLLNLSGYIALKELSLTDMYLYPAELSTILCLPSLTRLELGPINCKHDMILFHPDNYPDTNLAPLETLSFMGETEKNRICCSENQIRVLLSRFTTLQLLIIPVDLFRLNENTWNNMKKEYQYRVTLKSQFEDVFEEFCSLANEDKLQDPL